MNVICAVIAVTGVVLVVAGVALFWPPLALCLTGVALMGASYLLWDDGA